MKRNPNYDPKKDDDRFRHEFYIDLEINEVDAFMILVHIMMKLGWREMYCGSLEKLMHHLEIIEE